MPDDKPPVERKHLIDTFDRLGALISEMWTELIDLRRKLRAEQDSIVTVNPQPQRRRDDPPAGNSEG